MLKKAGLPDNLRLRHDFHFVEELTNKATGVVGRMIPIDRIDPNPNQPRYEIGDIGELVQSIREKGIIEPLVVRPMAGRYQLISGERRYRAAVQIGLTEVPCVERDVDDREALELALIENLQRKDLTAFEEADGFRALADQFGYTHDDIARKIGKARNSITETIRISDIPDSVREFCRRADIASKSVLLQIARCHTPEEMLAMIETVTKHQLTRDNVRAFRREKKPRKILLFKYKTDDGQFSCAIRYKKDAASKQEIIQRLRELIARLEAQAEE